MKRRSRNREGVQCGDAGSVTHFLTMYQGNSSSNSGGNAGQPHHRRGQLVTSGLLLVMGAPAMFGLASRYQYIAKSTGGTQGWQGANTGSDTDYVDGSDLQRAGYAFAGLLGLAVVLCMVVWNSLRTGKYTWQKFLPVAVALIYLAAGAIATGLIKEEPQSITYAVYVCFAWVVMAPAIGYYLFRDGGAAAVAAATAGGAAAGGMMMGGMGGSPLQQFTSAAQGELTDITTSAQQQFSQAQQAMLSPISQAQQSISNAKQDLTNTVMAPINAAQQQVADARQDLAQAKQDLTNAAMAPVNAAQQQIADAKQDLAQAKQDLTNTAMAPVNEAQQQWTQAQQQFGQAQQDLSNSVMNPINSAQQELSQAQQQLSQAQQQFGQMQTDLQSNNGDSFGFN